VTTQNHGYAVDEASLTGSDVVVTHRNLNDGTVEGLRHRTLPILSVQYHPEGRPGPLDSGYLFDQWMDLIAGRGDREALPVRTSADDPR
jgi:carbamoyl-phosphate synthase small subunit